MEKTMKILKDNNVKKIAMIAEQAPETAKILLIMCGIEEKHAEYLTAPIIVFGNSHSEILRAGRLLHLIYRQRVERIIEEHNNGLPHEMCTLAEIVAYLSCASLEAPLPGELTDVFLYAFQETYKNEINDFNNQMGFDAPIELSDYERRYSLEKLQRFVRKEIETELQKRRKKLALAQA